MAKNLPKNVVPSRACATLSSREYQRWYMHKQGHGRARLIAIIRKAFQEHSPGAKVKYLQQTGYIIVFDPGATKARYIGYCLSQYPYTSYTLELSPAGDFRVKCVSSFPLTCYGTYFLGLSLQVNAQTCAANPNLWEEHVEAVLGKDVAAWTLFNTNAEREAFYDEYF